MSCVRQFIKSKAGVTLVELVSAMGIASIIAGVPAAAFKASMDAADKGQVTSEMIGDTRLVGEWITRDVHNADSFNHLSAQRLDMSITELRDVRYTIAEGKLTRSVFDGGSLTAEETILADVNSLKFKARDQLKELIPDLDAYPDTGLSPTDMEAMKLVSTFMSVERQGNTFSLRMSARINTEESAGSGNSNAVLNVDLNRGYASLQAAIDDPDLTAGMLLRTRAITFTEDVTTDKSFSVEGGWNNDFTEREPGNFTILDGSLTLDGGKVKLKWFKII